VRGDSPNHVVGRLYLGDVSDAVNNDKLYEYNIGLVVSIMNAGELRTLERTIEQKVCVRPIEYIQMPAEDKPSTNLHRHIYAFRDIVAEYEARHPNKCILVHCKAGISRSATLVLSYLMLRYGARLDEAVRYLKARRRIINPNPGFMKQLQKLDVKICSVSK
jgi:protein-tyrosine phosphatase